MTTSTLDGLRNEHPVKHHRRRSIRLPCFDYTQAGAYFVTICACERDRLFGDIVNGEMRLNPAGEIIRGCWMEIPGHFPDVELDALVVMPNHVHGIICIVGATHAPPLHRSGPKPHSIGAIVGSFKSAVAKRINAMRGATGVSIWQRNYYEHVVRNEADMDKIRAYIAGNPAGWGEDEYNQAVDNLMGGS